MTADNTLEKPLIALISGTPAAVEPATTGMATEFSDATVWNILDDRLLTDANAIGSVSPHLYARMTRLIEHARAEGAAGILVTCSMYGGVAHDFDTDDFPILAADDAVFAAGLTGNYRRILLVASFASALADTEQRFAAAAAAAGRTIDVLSLVPDGAFAATQAKDPAALTAALIAACLPFVGAVDAVLLGQYSLAPTADALEAAIGIPVLSGPTSAAALLRNRLDRVTAS
jgi:Asp/Glu/hydantoin racemase